MASMKLLTVSLLRLAHRQENDFASQAAAYIAPQLEMSAEIYSQ